MNTIPHASIAALLGILFFLTIGGCTRHLQEVLIETPHAQFNLLIAGDASAYKDGLRTQIIKSYQERANIRVININKLGNMTPKDFHAVLIMDTCLAWTHFNPTVRTFLEQPSAKDRVVWFMTVDDTEDQYSHNGVDAITAASVAGNQKRVVRQIARQVDEILSGYPE